jgi:hypothetical protein
LKKKGKIRMRSILIVACIAVLPACGTEPAGSSATTEPAAPAMEVTAFDLAQAFDDNEVAAKQKYGNRPLLVTGTVAGVTLDFMDQPVVQMTGVNEFLPVQANFEGDVTEETGQLSKGQEITLRCKKIGEVIGAPMLDGCSFEKAD